jgi:hypothetical protein
MAKTRKLFTPAIIPKPGAATSAISLATGMTPVPPPPLQPSNAPVQSAKLIIIDGVGPSCAGLANSPSVACVAASSAATNDRATAAYRTLPGPVASAVMFPKVEDVPE